MDMLMAGILFDIQNNDITGLCVDVFMALACKVYNSLPKCQ